MKKGNAENDEKRSAPFCEYACEKEYYDGEQSFRKCDFCGYDILPDQEAIKAPTGDILHRECWSEYAEDNCLCICDPYVATEQGGIF